jgi:Putative amidase domain
MARTGWLKAATAVAGAIIGSTVWTSANAAASSSPETSSPATQTLSLSSITALAHQYLTDRANLMLTTASGAPLVAKAARPQLTSIPLGGTLAASAPSQAATLTMRRANDLAAGVAYAKAEVTLTNPILKKNADGSVQLNVVDDTKLYFRASAGSPPYEEWSVPRTFTFGAAVTGAQLLAETSPASGGAETTDVPATSAPVASSPLPPGAASTSRSTAIAPKARRPAVGGYNYAAMANFEITYWNGLPSGDYGFAEECTDFLSYALKAGGWTLVGQQASNTTNDTKWYMYTSPNYPYGDFWSNSWSVAQDWNTYARNSGRVAALSNIYSTTLADVVQAKWPGYTTIQHTMMVTGFTNGMQLMTYHTNNTLNRPLIDIVNTNPGTTWYADRT